MPYSPPVLPQHVLVTGSTRGIGRAVVEQLARAGCTVGVHGRSAGAVDEVCTILGPGQAIPLIADLTEPGSGTHLVQAFLEHTDGRLDGLVNNAGTGRAAPFRAMTAERWRQTCAVNIDAAFETCRAAYGVMRRQKRGGIVNVASISGHGPGKWMGADYAASKAALISLTHSLAFEAARFGIRVNAVSPGFVNTEMTRSIDASMRERLDIPLRRFAEPAEIASVIAFLLSSDATYITGQVLEPNGGLRM